MSKQIQLWKNKIEMSNYYTTVNDDVWELLKHEKFYLQIIPNKKTGEIESTYAKFGNKRITGVEGHVYLHRFVLELAGVKLLKTDDVDHINGDQLMNIRENLRSGSHSENMGNMGCHCDKKSKWKNVYNCGDDYQVIIMKDGKYYCNFHSDNILEAVVYANRLRKQLFGPFAFEEKLDEFTEEEIKNAEEKINKKLEYLKIFGRFAYVERYVKICKDKFNNLTIEELVKKYKIQKKQIKKILEKYYQKWLENKKNPVFE